MIKVLMLGWEFPPHFSGGLGIATYGLVKELSNFAQICLIVPTVSEPMGSYNFDLVGLNRLNSGEVNLEREAFNLLLYNAELFKVPVCISPYPPG